VTRHLEKRRSACRDYWSQLELQKTGLLSIPLLNSKCMGELSRSIGQVP
jgi:hypothetical protein